MIGISMKRIILAAAGLMLAAAPTAFAQAERTVPDWPDTKMVPAATGVTTPAAPGTELSSLGIRQELTNNLVKAGYTGVKVVPSAFIIEAANKSGQPVIMFISPDSMTVFTAEDAKGKDARVPPRAAK